MAKTQTGPRKTRKIEENRDSGAVEKPARHDAEPPMARRKGRWRGCVCPFDLPPVYVPVATIRGQLQSGDTNNPGTTIRGHHTHFPCRNNVDILTFLPFFAVGRGRAAKPSRASNRAIQPGCDQLPRRTRISDRTKSTPRRCFRRAGRQVRMTDLGHHPLQIPRVA